MISISHAFLSSYLTNHIQQDFPEDKLLPTKEFIANIYKLHQCYLSYTNHILHKTLFIPQHPTDPSSIPFITIKNETNQIILNLHQLLATTMMWISNYIKNIYALISMWYEMQKYVNIDYFSPNFVHSFFLLYERTVISELIKEHILQPT